MPELFVINNPRPFVRIMSEEMRSWRGRPLKDAVRLLQLSDLAYARQGEECLTSDRPKRREPLCSVTDESLTND
jgi:hypothetical protein